MSDASLIAALTPFAYLLGTFPTASIVARDSGINIRAVGSGNPGASNIMRVLGWRRGVLVFAIDALKGAIAAGVGLAVAGRPGGYVLAAAAIIGHVYPIWTRFRGGKGVATGGGAFLVLAPAVLAVLAAVWLVVSRATHTAAAASIVVMVLAPLGVALVYRSWWEFAATACLAALIVFRHGGNIQRLMRHQEHSLSERETNVS